MDGNKIVNEYFTEFEKESKSKVIDQIMGSKYSFMDGDHRGQILRFFIDNNLDSSISKVKSRKTYLFNYVDKSDLLIIGYCLDGKKIIDYKGKNTIKKGDVFYFRPTENFSIELFGHSFLYYFLDLNYFKKSLCCRQCSGNCCGNCNKLYCNSYGDHICNRGEVNIERAPYIMKSYVDEIKKIKDIEIDSFVEYTNIKGQLFNYLNWFIKLRLDRNPDLENNNCGLCYVSRAKKIIIDNLENQITVKEIAEKLDTSTYKLQKGFKKVEGTTVYNFIRKAKIDNSKILLKESNLPIIDIAQKVGYENPSKFSTAFKNITGYTPTEYREIFED